MSLHGKTVVVTAGNRGGGAVIANRYKESGANVVVIADKQSDVILKNESQPDNTLLIAIDLSDFAQIENAVKMTFKQFGSVDILVNNFSIFNFKNVMNTTPEEYHNVMRNIFVTMFFSKSCVPYLKNSLNPHIINIAPPINLDVAPEACKHHLLFSISKYGMGFCTLGMSEEFKPFGIAVNSLWQERPIATKTLTDNFNNDVLKGSNRPELYAEAAYLISLKSAKEFTGNDCIDEDILRESGIDLTPFAVDPCAKPVKDIFLSGVDYSLFKKILG